MRQPMCFGPVLLLVIMITPVSVFADEGRIQISSPTYITAPGSYILVNNIYANNEGIVIHSDNVTLDLNGFSIINTGGMPLYSAGVIVASSNESLEISNGTISGFGKGISIEGSLRPADARISNLRITDNEIGIALDVRPGFIIEDCFITGNVIGIRTYNKGLIVNNVIADNSEVGLKAHSDNNPQNAPGFRSNVFYGNGVDVIGAPTNLDLNLYWNGILIMGGTVTP